MDKQWRPTRQHRELYPISCVRTWWKLIWEEEDDWVALLYSKNWQNTVNQRYFNFFLKWKKKKKKRINLPALPWYPHRRHTRGTLTHKERGQSQSPWWTNAVGSCSVPGGSKEQSTSLGASWKTLPLPSTPVPLSGKTASPGEEGVIGQRVRNRKRPRQGMWAGGLLQASRLWGPQPRLPSSEQEELRPHPPYTNTEGSKGNNEPWLPVCVYREPQSLFSYPCRQLLNYAFPQSRIISSLTSLQEETPKKVHRAGVSGYVQFQISISKCIRSHLLRNQHSESAWNMSVSHKNTNTCIRHHSSELKREKWGIPIMAQQ